jgi:hypothetical protein
MAFERKYARSFSYSSYFSGFNPKYNFQWDEIGYLWSMTVPLHWDVAGEGGENLGDFRPDERNAQTWTRVSIQDP